MASELADLVLSGRKTATASLLAMNELDPDESPRADGFSVVTDFDGEPMCVIQTCEIRHLPFDEVDEQFAADEGEGDLSYEYWRQVHWDYFSREAEDHGLEFDAKSIICCERFRLRFP
ncbi:MAG TPA: ASCH domain-containing protein [Pyrinomonadaceae bacterium]|nr:ASCH domain-containing protein [Pyrinomonadaceae bacterium]